MDFRLLILREGDRRRHDVNTMLDTVMKLPTDKPWEAEVRRHYNGLSHQQRRTYRMWLGEIADQTGDDAEALHEHFLKTHAPRLVKNVNGQPVEIIKRTGSGRNDMRVPEMSEYMTKVQRDALTMGLTLTQPMGDSTW